MSIIVRKYQCIFIPLPGGSKGGEKEEERVHVLKNEVRIRLNKVHQYVISPLGELRGGDGNPAEASGSP